MRTKTTFYIGGDNVKGIFTPLMEITLEDYLDKALPEGYTILKTVGHWKNTSEEGRMVIAFSEEPLPIDVMITHMCRFLKQESILVEQTPLGYGSSLTTLPTLAVLMDKDGKLL
jgi:hypothetical protein